MPTAAIYTRVSNYIHMASTVFNDPDIPEVKAPMHKVIISVETAVNNKLSNAGAHPFLGSFRNLKRISQIWSRYQAHNML